MAQPKDPKSIASTSGSASPSPSANAVDTADSNTADNPGVSPATLKLLVPTNFSQKSEMALMFALVFSFRRGLGGAEIYLFHSYDVKNFDYRQLDRINEEVTERMKTTVLATIDKLDRMGFGHGTDTVHRRLSYGKPPGEILKMAAGISADMICMGSPSNTNFRGLIEKAPCSLVMLKTKDPTFVME